MSVPPSPGAILADAWHALQLGQYELVERLLVESIDQPHPERDRVIAFLRAAQGRWSECVDAWTRVVAHTPHDPDALTNLGTALQHLGRLSVAADCYRLALRFNPQQGIAWNNLGVIHQASGQLAAARDCHQQALEINPHHISALSNLAAIDLALEAADAARERARQALTLDPTHAESWANLAAACQLQGDVPATRSAWQEALTLRPDQPAWRIAAATVLPVLYNSSAEIEQIRDEYTQRLNALIADQVQLDPVRHPVPIHFHLPYQGRNDRSMQQQFAKLICPGEEWTAARLDSRRRVPGRMRIGFVSRFFGNHTIGHLFQGLIQQLARRDWDLHLLHLGDSTGDVAAAMRQNTLWQELPRQPALAAEQIAALDLDWLGFADVGMEPVSLSLSFLKLARRQAVFWGHPVTTGSPTIDDFISSTLLESDAADEHYSERLVRLPQLPLWLEPLPMVSQKPATRDEFNLPATGPIYACPQSLFKFHPEFDLTLRQILESVDRARLVVIEGAQSGWTESLRQRWQRTLGPQQERILFVSRMSEARFLRLLSVTDILLDPTPFGGGLTTLQALQLGRPIVTVEGEFLRGRVTSGCLRQMELDELICTTAQEYVARAIEWGQQPELREQVSRRLFERQERLFRQDRAVDALEAEIRSSCALVD